MPEVTKRGDAWRARFDLRPRRDDTPPPEAELTRAGDTLRAASRPDIGKYGVPRPILLVDLEARDGALRASTESADAGVLVAQWADVGDLDRARATTVSWNRNYGNWRRLVDDEPCRIALVLAWLPAEPDIESEVELRARGAAPEQPVSPPNHVLLPGELETVAEAGPDWAGSVHARLPPFARKGDVVALEVLAAG